MTCHKKDDKIILVDDNPCCSWILEQNLRDAGFENIETFDDPRSALESIRQNTRPAIVISDYRMPFMTGLELLSEIELHHPEIEAVIVSAEPSSIPRENQRYTVLDKSPDLGRIVVDIVKRILQYNESL